MLSANNDFADQPKLVYENPTKELDSPIRLIADEGNKENVHILESDCDEDHRNALSKKARMDYSSPEKIEMFDNLSPIKIDTEGESDEKVDERAAVMDIQRSLAHLRDEEEEKGEELRELRQKEEALQMERDRTQMTCNDTMESSGCEKDERLQSTNEMMSPIIVSKIRDHMKYDAVEDKVWEEKFSDLSERIQRKNHEIRLLNTENKDLENKINEITEDREKWELLCIQLEKSKTKLEAKLQSDNVQLQKYADLQTEHERLSSRFESCKQRLKEVKIEFNMLTQNNQILTDKFEKEYTKFTDNENLVNEWKSKYDSINNAYNDLKKEIMVTSENLCQKEKILEDKDLEIGKLHESLSRLQQEIEEKKLESDEQLQKKDQELSDLKDKLSANESQRSTLVSRLNELNDNQQSLLQKTKELEILQAELESKELENKDIVSKLENLMSSNEENISKFERAQRELDSLKSKSGIVEAEHLSELESLHENMSQMETNMKQNIQRISELTSELSELQERYAQLETENSELKLNGTKPEQQENSDVPNQGLQSKVAQLEKALQDSEKETNKRLQLLAEDLYIQYSSKHEQKVRMLKKGYETKYQDLIDKLTVENTAMKDEVKQLQHSLETERQEKQDLIKALD